MFKKLRIKFIAIVMASVALVLAVVFTAVCYSEFQRATSSVNNALETSINRAIEQELRDADSLSSVPPFEVPQSSEASGSPNSYAPPSDQSQGRVSSQNNSYGPRIGGGGMGAENLVPVAVYRLDGNDLTIVSGIATATMTDSVTDEAVTRIVDASEGNGTFADLGLHYSKRVVDGTTYVAFADTASTDSWQSLALRLLVAGIATLAVFFVLSLFFSNWALKPVKDAWDSQRRFIADASHELKTPLTVILANASILLKHPESTIASQSQWIESTQIEANGMQELVGEMLELAQVEERVQIEHAPLDFSDLVDSVALQFEAVAFERGCSFDSEIAEGLTVSGNQSRLRKMVSTLIENALKYVDKEGVVDVVLEKAGNTARLKIRNTGSVIAVDDLPHIFDRFYRTDKARTSGTGGYGLGLAIARETAREHGGDITCASDERTGTTFVVSLPLA